MKFTNKTRARKTNNITADTIARAVKKQYPTLSLGILGVSNVINSEKFWQEFVLFFYNYLQQNKK